MNTIRALAAFLALAWLAAGCGSSGILPISTYGATLNGANEVPLVVTLATGTAVMTYNDVSNTFDIVVTVNGIAAGNITGWHIHAAPAGSNGGVILDFGALGINFMDIGGGTLRAEGVGIAFPPANEADLEAGDCYLNVHTIAVPSGEIRGQLDRVI